MEDKLLVIKESDLDKLTKSAGVTYPTFPASEVFEAALREVDINKPEEWKERYGDAYYITSGMELYRLYPTYTDYEKTKI